MQAATETVNVYAAKTHFSNLLRRAEAGEVIVIARNGVPAAKLVPIDAPTKKPNRVFGGYEGQIWWSDDAFDPLSPEEQALFEAPLFLGEDEK